jgi:hypothetical protein
MEKQREFSSYARKEKGRLSRTAKQAARSGIAGTAQTNVRVNFQKAVTGRPHTGHILTIGPLTYNSEDHGFDLPWPFGSESNQQ